MLSNTNVKLNCKSCLSGNCDVCSSVNCLCREGHSKRELENAFTEKMRELLPTYDEFKIMLQSYDSSQQLTLFEKPIEDIKPNRWITIGEQNSFSEFLDTLGYDPSVINDLEWCASKWEKYRCSVNHSHTNKTRYVACGRRGICPRCSMGYASKRANIMYQWVKQNLADRLDFDLKLNQIVLTLPEHLHDMDTKLFAKMIKKFMKSFGIEAHGYSIQTRHSKDPLSGRYIHAHLLSLNMRVENDHIIKSAYYFDLDEMREVWKKIIEDYTDSVIEGSVNLHSEYASVIYDKPKVLHMFAYLYRYPIQDLFNVQIRKQSINYVQSPQFEKINGRIDNSSEFNEVRTKVMELIDEDKPRLVWCGLLTSTKRKELIKMILHVGMNETLDGTPYHTLQLDDNDKPAFEWKSMSDIEKEMELRAKECRDCGSPYENEPFDRGQYQGDNEPKC